MAAEVFYYYFFGGFWIFQLCCFCWVLGFFVILQANTFGLFCQLDFNRRYLVVGL